MTCDIWHVTRGTWHVTHYTQEVVNTVLKFQLPSFNGLGIRTVFRCLSPFKIGIHIYLEQSVWAELSWNPFWKRIASICFEPNHSGKKYFWKSYFQFLCWNCFFWTNMESNAAVTLHFEDIAVKNYLFLKDVRICWWKISNCSKKHFWWLWSFSF